MEGCLFQETDRYGVLMVNDFCACSGFYACAIPKSCKHSWNVFLFTYDTIVTIDTTAVGTLVHTVTVVRNDITVLSQCTVLSQ